MENDAYIKATAEYNAYLEKKKKLKRKFKVVHIATLLKGQELEELQHELEDLK